MAANDSANALILGATSDIARAAAEALAADGYALQLAARRADALERERADLSVRTGRDVASHVLDILDTARHAEFIAGLDPVPEVVVCVVGGMGDQAVNQTDADAAARVIATNFTAPAQLLGRFANLFEERGHGVIVGVGSVAGDRGRAKNYVYGSAKAGFAAFLSGLRNRLTGSGVHVATVKPGYVRTRMTEGLDLPRSLTATPAQVGEAIWRAVARRRDETYVLPIWWLVMTIVRAIPERIFKRLDL